MQSTSRPEESGATMRRALSLLSAAAIAVGLATVQVAPAQAKFYSYGDYINCGTLSGIRQASLVAYGTYSSKLHLSGYSFRWSNHVSRLGYSACGRAAPYGSYPVHARKASLRTDFVVSSARLKGCKTTGKSGVSVDKSGGKVSVDVEASCSLGKGVRRERLTSNGVPKKVASLRHGGTI